MPDPKNILGHLPGGRVLDLATAATLVALGRRPA